MDYGALKKLFAYNADENEAQAMSAYMRGMFKYYGIPAPKRREILKQFFAGDKKTDPINWQFIFDCWGAEEREMQYTAMDYLDRHSKQLTKADIPALKKLVTEKSWWDTVDGIDRFVGDIALIDTSVNKILLEWSKDPNFWLHRIAIDHQLERKEKTDTKLLSEIIKNNLNQTEFFINKAIGWALREYSKTDPKWVSKFIDENKDNMSKLSIKEASKYL